MSNNQPEKIEFKGSPEAIGKMTSQEVRAAISANYPDYKEDVCRAYMTGAMTSARYYNPNIFRNLSDDICLCNNSRN